MIAFKLGLKACVDRVNSPHVHKFLREAWATTEGNRQLPLVNAQARQKRSPFCRAQDLASSGASQAH